MTTPLTVFFYVHIVIITLNRTHFLTHTVTDGFADAREDRDSQEKDKYQLEFKHTKREE